MSPSESAKGLKAILHIAKEIANLILILMDIQTARNVSVLGKSPKLLKTIYVLSDAIVGCL